MHCVLLTGFEPFGGESVNPSIEAVKRVGAEGMDGVVLETLQMPCVFGDAIDVLAAAMRRFKPDIVICVGQAGGRAEISVERVAINVNDARIADNIGNQPIDEAIVADGPAAYFSTLPIKAIVAAMHSVGIPAEVSQTAGTYVCNHLFYGLSHLIATEFPDVRGGFIHIPYLPEQAVRQRGAPSMSLDTIVRALQVAIGTTMAMTFDVRIAGGATH
jgi:pyroglutamyl-peptidase